MSFIRPVKMSDLEALWSFANEVGFGFTTLAKNKSLIEQKILKSIESFRETIKQPYHESYLFVLEHDGKTIGCSGLFSRIGMSEPFYAYHLLSFHQECPLLNISQDIGVLNLIKARKKPTELCTLFLKKEFRHSHFGRLLSLSRLLFIACYRYRFASLVIAELRGHSDSEGNSPFYDAIARPFFKTSFQKASELKVSHPECIEELFPHHPIYVNLLSQEAQNAIGKRHHETEPAMKLLEKQGFATSHYFDIFDAGPHLFAHTDEINVVKTSQQASVSKITSQGGHQKALVSNHSLDFRAVIGEITVEEAGLIITPELAKALQVNQGDLLRFFLF